MPTPLFHPVVDTWFRQRYGEPTDPQRLGWPEIAAGRNTLIAAPTGSGKTFAAFLVCIDRLLRESLEGRLRDETRILYISPLKALSNDIRRNLETPLEEIQAAALDAGHLSQRIRTSVRTGDTPAHERAAMLKSPPHILVTTPESVYVLLTSPRGRQVLSTVDTVIVDEVHALARDKRGSHLALTLERLEALCSVPPVRIGLSATQKPMNEIAGFLIGSKPNTDCAIIDAGHLRQLDLNIVVPLSDLGAVCSNEQWDEADQQLADLIQAHRSTLIFVNTRRMAERLSHRLRDRLGEDAVAGHHGSMSKDMRLSVEDRLKKGELKAIVATASLELGIDIGFIDLVCQIGSPRSIATFLQRVGRSGHRLGVVPKGRLFALTRDEAMEGLALLRAVKLGQLDRVIIPVAPLDILTQQIIAEVACQDWNEDDLYNRFKQAWPYRDLTRKDFDSLLPLISEGLARGKKEGAYVHRDILSHTLRARRSARLSALTSGGAIPETADYRVVTEGEGTFVGTVNEDFAIESMAGDVFLLGNTSWRIRAVREGQVIVQDAEGAPASVPFWLGEAPGRTLELSRVLSDLREDISKRTDPGREDEAAEWLKTEYGIEDRVAQQAVLYVTAQKAAVGFVPTQSRILFERFFDDSGGMQLVVHTPFGSRINRAWGLAMRKRFCRTFDFELQASADDNGVVLSLGPQHSFPLPEMFKLLKSDDAEGTLVQALLAAPVFQVRWRWNVTRALGVLRMRGGKKVPPPLQRFKSEDLLTAVFPLQTACFEHRPPEVPIPDHPLVHQTVYDCLHEAMDIDGWTAVLKDIEDGVIHLEARDTREPSPFSHSILNANPYAFLDDAPLEERRARAVALRRTLSVEDFKDLARLDPEAIDLVKSEAWPLVRNAEELHDMLLSVIVLPEHEGTSWKTWFDELVKNGRATTFLSPHNTRFWTAAERWSHVQAAYPSANASPAIQLPDDLLQPIEASDALKSIIRGRMEIIGPITVGHLSSDLGLPEDSTTGALQRLEAEGIVMQGHYSQQETGNRKQPTGNDQQSTTNETEGALDKESRLDNLAPSSSSFSLSPVDCTLSRVEWCERRLLARIHRLTLAGARQKVQAVPPDVYWRMLSEFHHLTIDNHREDPLGLREAIGQLQGFEIATGSWENDILSSRVKDYQPEWLDQLCFSGELAWGRMKRPVKLEEEPTGSGMTRVVPVSLAFRSDLPWLLSTEDDRSQVNARPEASAVYSILQARGALFFDDLASLTQILPTRLEDALSELAALGTVTADGFAAIRNLLHARQLARQKSRSRWAGNIHQQGGRWTVFPPVMASPSPRSSDERAEKWARQLLYRYGIVFRDLLMRESVAPAWWQLLAVYRRMEARGEIRGGRFVSGVAGEQYALPEAVEMLRRSRTDEDHWVAIAATDPLNVSGIVTPGPRVPALRTNRLLYHNGKLAAVLVSGDVQYMDAYSDDIREKISRVLRVTELPHLRETLLKELSGVSTKETR